MRHLRGQTFIELLIAMAVITTGLFAAVTMVFSNMQLSDRDSDEIVAMNLAREGIEEAKALRDSNWLAGDAFDNGLVSGNDYTAIPRWNGAVSPGLSFDFAADTFTDAATQVRRSTSFATPGFYTQVDPGATLTPWRRLLTFHPICETASGLTYPNDGQDCGSDPKIGIRVEVAIQWQRKGKTFNRTIYEDLFDWR